MAKFRAIRLYQYTSRGKWYQIGTEFESEYNKEIRDAISRAQIVEVVEAKPIEQPKTIEPPKTIEQATTEQGSDDKKRRSKGEKEVTSTEKTADAEKGVGE